MNKIYVQTSTLNVYFLQPLFFTGEDDYIPRH